MGLDFVGAVACFICCFLLQLAHNLTSVDLGFLAKKLEDLIDIVEPKVQRRPEILTKLRLSVLHLQTYQTRLVEPMTAVSRELMVKDKPKFIITNFAAQNVPNNQ